MREISGVVGPAHLDKRQGFGAVSDEQRDGWAVIQAHHAANATALASNVHSSEIQRRQEQEAERERQRKAGPPKRELLAAAHAVLAEADRGVADLMAAIFRSSEFVAGIEARKAGIESALRDIEGDQTARLFESSAPLILSSCR